LKQKCDIKYKGIAGFLSPFVKKHLSQNKN